MGSRRLLIIGILFIPALLIAENGLDKVKEYSIKNNVICQLAEENCKDDKCEAKWICSDKKEFIVKIDKKSDTEQVIRNGIIYKTKIKSKIKDRIDREEVRFND